LSELFAAKPRLRKVAAAAAFLCLLALIAQPIWEGRHQWHWGQAFDDGVYWVSAKGLAQGDGYRVISLPGRPYATKYPPLYPLYLSLAWRLQPNFPANLPLAAALQALLVPIYLAGVMLVLRQLGLSGRRLLLISAMTIVTFEFVRVAITLYSELLSGCFLFFSILLTESAGRDSGSRRRAAAGGLLAGLAYLTRTAALPLFAAVPIFFFLKKRPRLTICFFAPLLPIAAGWHAWTAFHSSALGESTNISYIAEYLRVIRVTGFWHNLWKQVGTLSNGSAETLFPGITGMLSGLPLYHLTLAGAIAGGIRLGRRRGWPLALIFSSLYLAMIACWWFDGIFRMMLPVWPFLLAGISEEASHIANLLEKDGLRGPVVRWAMVAMGLIVILHNELSVRYRIAAMVSQERQLRLADRPALRWIARHASPDEVVLAWKDSVSFLYTGVPSSHALFVSYTPEPEDIKALGGSPAALPARYRQALLLVLASDLGDGYRGFDTFRAAAAKIPGAELKYSSDAALIYGFPLPR